MLRAVRRGWFSSETEVRDDSGTPIATIDLSNWRENAKIEVSGEGFLARHETWSGEFVLEREGGGEVVARAEKPSAFRELLTLEHGGRRYELTRQSGRGSGFVLTSEDAGPVGTIGQRGAFSSELAVDLPEELPVPVQMMVLWLAMILRRRQAAAAGGAAAGT